MLPTAAPRGQQGLLSALRHLCSSPAFVPGPRPCSQPTGPEPHCWPGCSPLPALPLPGLPRTQMPDPILGQWWGGSAHPAQPSPPASQPGCLPPATCLSPLPLLPTPPDLPRVRPSNNLSSLLLPLLIPLFLALQSLGVGLSLSHALSAPPSPRSSSPIFPPPASTPSPAHSPSPSPAAPPSSPTSLFQLRAGSSGQFPHRSASGEETAPPR